MKRWGLLLALLLLAGCVAQPAQTPADRAITYWLGRPLDEVIGAWGPPTEEMTEEGRHRYLWSATHYGRSYYPANLYGQPLPFGRAPQELACKGVLEVDERGIVTAASWEGYECHYLP